MPSIIGFDFREYGKDKLGDFYESIMKNKDESYSRVDTKLF